MTELIVVFWYWWAFALVCLVLEILTPGFFFMWLAASGLITGTLVFFVPALSLNAQIFIFSVLAIAAVILWRFYGKKITPESDQPLLNQRGAQYVGRVFNLYEAIENGQGKIKVDDSIWKVHGEDCDIHSKVKVVGVRGTVFDVKKLKE
jgi:membrane protein implicated in regulation of membrane protease activity